MDISAEITEDYINTPSNLTTTYDGNNHWIDSFAATTQWLEDYHLDSDYVTVSNITYKDNLNSPVSEIYDSETSVALPDIKNAGVYTVKMKLSKDAVNRWGDETITEKTFTITVKKATPNVTPKFATTLPNPLYISYNDGKLPELVNAHEKATPGIIEWRSGEKPTEGKTEYYWQFTPEDENDPLIKNNYLAITEKSDATKMTVTYKSQGVKNLEIVLHKDGEGDDAQPVNIYDAFTLADGDYSVKKFITVYAVKDDGVTKVELKDNEYDLELDDGSENLSVGSATLVAINADGKTGKLNITALESKVIDLLVTYKDNGTHLKYSDKLSYDDVKNNLTVRAQWNYSGDDYLEVKDKTKYTITGDIKAGAPITLTVNYGGKTKDFKPTIDKGDYSISDSLFPDKTVTHTGTAYNPDGWIDITKLPAGMTVTYSCDTDLTSVGTHTVTATFSNPDPDNYNDPATKTATLTISDKPTYEMDGVTFDNAEVKYDGNSHTLVISGDLPDGVTVKYYLGEEEFTGATDVDDYEIVAKFTGSNEFAPIDDRTATLKITKADYDMSGIELTNKTVTFNDTEYTLAISGNLPEWITVKYYYNGEEFTGVSAAGTYEITAKFEHNNDNYNPIDDMTATLTISDAVVTEIKAELSEKQYTTANTLDDLKSKLKVTAIYNNGTTAEIEDYEISFTGLRDNGKLKYGNQSLTVKYGEFTAPIINNVMVSREKVALPTFKGGLNYTGLELKPKAADFNGYDETLMTFVVDKTVAGLYAGAYKAVFALNDPENYEWTTVTTNSKKVFAAVVYDGEITLNANEAAVDWNISKAVLTATKAEGGLPVFASDSYIGAFADIVTMRYYKDEACTEEVAADQLAKETQYFVKAELLDTDNFELDASAAQYTVKSFTYTTPAKELTVWDKIVRFIKTNWLWLVIAVVALILFIVVIALIARSAKKKREREEQRRLEEKEERRREQEERDRREEERRQREDERRREEREERMAARMAQPQMMMPQMPQMPQMQAPQAPQPQYAPQAAPGVSDSALLISIENQLSALRSEQTAATRLECEMAKLRADLKVGQPLMTDANTGKAVTVDTLTEIITLALKNVLAPNAQQAAEQKADNAAAPAVAQVPPDAVMTTVTTTKIDTTKKPAQNAQAQGAPVRTVVRNVVAPMPVDDGRVFDVGGFYKPADPITDMGFTDDEKSE